MLDVLYQLQFTHHSSFQVMGDATAVSADKHKVFHSSEDVTAQASKWVGQTCLETLCDNQAAPDLQDTSIFTPVP